MRLQDEIRQWQMDTFGDDQTDMAVYEKLQDELQELGSSLYYMDHEELKFELADMGILLMGLASKYKIDFIGAVKEKLNINRKRIYAKDLSGAYQHLEL